MSIDRTAADSDEAVRQRLAALPAYRNTAFRSLLSRVRFFAHVLASRIAGRRRPLFVVLVTNNRCNLSCSYCYGKYGERHHYQDYSTAELVRTIDELWDLGTRYLTVHGGESLLRQDIGLLLNYMKRKGFYVSLNTNGVLVPKKIGEIRCVDTVCVSLDGAEEANDRNRGKGSYRMAMEAIEVLLANKVPLAVSATLTRHNVGDMEYLAQMAQDRGFRLQYSILYNTGKLGADEVLSDREVREVTRKILALKEQGYPIYYAARALTAVLDWPYPLNEKPFVTRAEAGADPMPAGGDRVPCYHGVLKYQIDADGRVITCWGHDDADAPNIKDLGVAGAIERCAERKDCDCCAFMANNEHNLMFGLDLRTVVELLLIQVRDAFKIRKGRP